MKLYFKIEGDLIIFFGDTYNHRPAIKSIGGRFNSVDKTWVVKDSESSRLAAAGIAMPQGEVPAPILKINSATAATAPTAVSSSPAPQPHDASLGLTISQLMTQADELITSGFPIPIWVVGEIQSLSRRAGGTLFFDFAESKTGAHQTATVTVKCNIWQNTFLWMQKRHGKDQLEKVFADGNRLRALVQVKLYKDRGQLSLTIEDIDPSFTQGALALARLELIRKLKAEGIFGKNKQLTIASFPFRVALITAMGSRAETDFCHQLTASGEFPGTIIAIPCSMQGDKVPRDVTASLKHAMAADADVIVICRGGGSAADLRWFDGEEIARAIGASTVPVIAAIGHHDDSCIAEDMAHTREKTPTAAADRILEVFRDTRSEINEKAHLLARALDREISQFERIQSEMRERLLLATDQYFVKHQDLLYRQQVALQRHFDGQYIRHQSNYASLAVALNLAARNRIDACADVLHQIERQLIKLDPSPWLAAGWTQLSLEGRPIQSIEQVNLQQILTARLKDGVLAMTITNKKYRPTNDRNTKL